MLQIPILRQGNAYTSLDIARVPHHQTRETFVEVSQANAGLIRRDLSRQEIARASLLKFTTRDLVNICARAAEHFVMTGPRPEEAGRLEGAVHRLESVLTLARARFAAGPDAPDSGKRAEKR